MSMIVLRSTLANFRNDNDLVTVLEDKWHHFSKGEVFRLPVGDKVIYQFWIEVGASRVFYRCLVGPRGGYKCESIAIYNTEPKDTPSYYRLKGYIDKTSKGIRTFTVGDTPDERIEEYMNFFLQYPAVAERYFATLPDGVNEYVPDLERCDLPTYYPRGSGGPRGLSRRSR